MELLSRPPVQKLISSLDRIETIVHRDNGNRSTAPADLLRRIQPLLRTVGISRVADISQLIPFGYPVFQAVRPNILFHSAIGQNTGAQGKGATRDQALLSAIMEGIEGFCAEPRNPEPLIRGSFDFLRRQHPVVDPRTLLHTEGVEPPGAAEPIMWTVGAELIGRQQVLVPAEAVFYPFLPADYATRSCFPCGTNGLASGGSYLEAVLHGIYEVVERHYIAEYELGRAKVERFHLADMVDLRDLATRAVGFSFHLFALTLPSLSTNLPVVMCVIEDQERQRSFVGYGCSATVQISVDRAISEAWQSVTGIASGAREDIVRAAAENHADNSPELPRERTLRVSEYKQAVVDVTHESLNQEYEDVVRWLQSAGIRSAFVSDLTRTGVDIPVVKTIIPGMNARRQTRRSSAQKVTSTHVLRRKYS